MSDRASIIAAAQARLNAKLAAASEPSPEAMQALLPPAPVAPDLAAVLGAPLPPPRPMSAPPVEPALADVLAAPPEPTMSRPLSAARSFGNAAAGVLGDTIKAPALAVSALERSTAAAVPERIALLEREVMDLTVGIENATRSGAPASMIADMTARRDRANAMLADATTAAPGLPTPRDPQQVPGWATGDAFKATVEGAIGAPDPAYRDDLLTSKVPSGFGSSAGFLVAGLPAALLGPAGWLGTALTGASVSAVGAFEEAIQHGADVGTALQAAGIMGPVGLSEALPIARAFDAVPGGKTAALAVARKILTNAAEEAVQEGGQTLAQNATAAGLGYDPNRPLTQSLGENMLVGAIVGGGTSAAVEGVRGLAGSRAEPSPATQPPAPPSGFSADVGASFAQPYEGLAAVLAGTPTAPQQPAPDPAPRVSTVPGVVPPAPQAPAAPVAPEPDLAAVLAGAPPSPADVNRSAPAAPAAPAPVATPPAVGAASLPPGVLAPGEEYMESDRDQFGREIDPVPGIWNSTTQTWRPLDAPAPVDNAPPAVAPAAPRVDAAPPQVDSAPDLAAVLAGTPAIPQNPAPESSITPSGVTPPDYDAAVQLVRESGKASASYLQRKLGLRYADATAMVDRMETEGVVSAADRNGRRTVMPQRTPEQLAIIEAAAARAAAKQQEPADVEPAAPEPAPAEAVPAGRDGDGAGAVEAAPEAGTVVTRDDAEAWWQDELAPAGRRRVMAAAGVDLPASVRWRSIRPEVQDRIIAAQDSAADASLDAAPAPEVSVTQKPEGAAPSQPVEKADTPAAVPASPRIQAALDKRNETMPKGYRVALTGEGGDTLGLFGPGGEIVQTFADNFSRLSSGSQTTLMKRAGNVAQNRSQRGADTPAPDAGRPLTAEEKAWFGSMGELAAYIEQKAPAGYRLEIAGASTPAVLYGPDGAKVKEFAGRPMRADVDKLIERLQPKPATGQDGTERDMSPRPGNPVPFSATPADANPSSDQPPADRVAVMTRLLDQLPQGEALRVQGFQSLNVDVQRGVLTKMIDSLQDPQVFRAVVEAVPIDVVNVLVGQEFSADQLLSDPSVLRQALAVPVGAPIPAPVARFVDAVAATGLPVTGPAAVGGGAGADVGVVPQKLAATSRAGERNQGQNAPRAKEDGPSVPSSAPAAYGSKNTVFTKDAADRAKALLRSRLNGSQLNSGIDPEVAIAGMTLVGFHVESGVRRFADVMRVVADDLGVAISALRPYARAWYNSARDGLEDAGLDVADMDGPDAVRSQMATVFAAEAPDADGRGLDQGGSGEAAVPGRGAEGPGAGEALDAAPAADGEAPAGAGTADPAGERPDAPEDRSGDGVREGGDAAERGAGDGDGRVPDAGPGDGADAGPRPAARPSRPNYVLANPERIVGGTPKQRFAKNRAAIEALQTIEQEGREPTPAELDAMAAYTGWGAFGQELFQGSWERAAPKHGWAEESQWLRDTLGETAWKGAQASIINAHYTDPPTVKAMWGIVEKLGFKGGRILEPSMGVGNFFSMMPQEIAQASDLTGIELDPTTGAMAKHLFPQANVRVMGYEQSRTPDDFYDLVIGNWPFANVSPADRRYDRLGLSLHNYFFVKALDQTRPGGLVVGVTSRFTMDAAGRQARMEMAKRGDLVAAFRLPTGAFEEYAGTAVVTDIIVLKKRESPNPDPATEAWVNTGTVKLGWQNDEFPINKYFLDNPTNVLGEIALGQRTTYGAPGLTVTRQDNFPRRLAALPSRVPEGVYVPVKRGKEPRFTANQTREREGAVVLQGEDLHVVQGDRLANLHDVKPWRMKDAAETATRLAQFKALIEIRRQYETLIAAERSAAPDIETQRQKLKNLHAGFVAAHGPMIDSFALKHMERVDDPHYATLAALEGTDGKPATIMDRSTMRPQPSLTNVTVRDAYVLARNENTVLDMARVAELAGVDEATARAELIESGAVYAVPGGGVEAADVYLSGNVVRKLAEARDAQDRGEDMARSIAALEKARPARVPYFAIEPQLGATWVSVPQHAQFIAEMLGVENTAGIDIAMVGGGWRVRLSRELLARPEARAGFGSADMRFDRLVTAAMGNRPLVVMGTDEDGKPVRDDEASKRASEAAQRIREHFTEWAYKDPERRLELEREFNDVFRAVADPQFDGSFLTFPGMALSFYGGDFDLRQHQRNAVWRGIVNGYGIYAHEVGTGKTATAAALAVESKRYGKAKKPILFAHNANSRAVFAEAQGMYPGARMLYVDNLSPKTIKTTLRRIANDDWDLIVVPHSVIDRLGMKRETLMALAQDEIAALEQEAIDAADEDGHSIANVNLDDPDAVKKIRSATAKELAKQRLRILAKIEKDAARAAREDAITFEDLGVDMILVDEAHVFKKPPIATKMSMRGLNRSSSDRSIALKFITDYVKTQRGGTGIHLFTGTPITNTLGEIFHMSRYVISRDMEAANVIDWDAWFNTFAAASADVEPAAGGGFEIVTRLRKFVNVAELRRMMGTALDVVFADDMPEFKPRSTASGKTMSDETLTDMERDELLNGRSPNAVGRPYKVTVNDIAPITPLQKQWLERIVGWANGWKAMTGKERMEAMHAGDPESPIIHKGIEPKVGLDVRMVEQGAPDEPDSKINRAVRRILHHYQESPDGAQVVFAEVGDSRESKVAGNTVTLDRSPIEDLIDKLVAGGVRREEIAIVGGGVKPEQKSAIAAKVNRGEVRVVIGKTETLGTGVNMQKRLRAMHHLDAPWMPGQLEQRNGRGWRQGNQWNTVYEYRYITEGVDGSRWNVLAVKDRFIQDFKRADDSVREIEGDAVDDADSADADSIMATLSEAIGDPRILQKEKLAKDVERLQRKERLHTEGVVDTKHRARQSRQEAQQIESDVRMFWQPDAARAEKAREAEGFEATIGGKVYKKRTEAAEALQREMQRLLPDIRRAASWNDAKTLGEVHGFEIIAKKDMWAGGSGVDMAVRGEQTYPMGAESLASAESVIRGIPKKAADEAARAAELRKSAARLDQMAEAPFAMAEQLAKREKMLADIDADLAENPVAPPMWLRRGAPVDSRIFVRREGRIVRGHRWATNGWFVLTDEGPVPYLDARDQYGVPLYQEVPWQEPADGSAVEIDPRYLLDAQDKTLAEMALDDDGNLIVREQRGVAVDAERRATPYGDMTNSDRFRAATSPEQMAKLRRMLDHYGLSRVTLGADTAGRATGRQAAFASTADGQRMAILMGASFDPAASLNHEVIHALRAANLFTDAEWATLETAARDRWMAQYRIAQRYGDLSAAQQLEEAIAEAFADGMQGTETQRITDPWRIALARVRRFFQIVKRWLGLQKLDSPAAIFGAVAEGVIGRGPRQGSPLGVRAEQRAIHANAFFAPNPSVTQAYRQTQGTYAAIRAGASPKAVETTFDELRRQLQDRMLPLLRAQQLIERSGVQLTEAEDVYLAEETFTGRTGARLRRIERRYIEPVMGIIAKSEGLTIDSVARYLTARHAPERNAHIASINPSMPDGGAGFDGAANTAWTTQHARQVRAQMEAGPDGDRLKRIARLMHRMRLESINARVEYGLLSEDQGRAWKAKFREYVPLRGFAEDDSLDATGVGQGFNVGGKESRMTMGRQSEAFNPLVAGFSMAQEVIARGEKNRVGQALHALAKAAPQGNGLMEVKTVQTKRWFNQSTGLVETRPVSPITVPQAERELAVKIKGVEHRVVIHDRAIMEAMKGLGAERMNAVLRMMRGLTQWMSMANTMFSPSFTAVNAARDFLTAHIQAPAIAGAQAGEIMAEVRGNYWTAMRAAARGLKGDYSGAWGTAFKEFEAAGGKIEFWKIEQPQEALETIERRMRIAGHKASFSDHVADWQRKPVLAWVERMNTAVDNAMRLAAFKAARDRGWSEKRAASLAKNLTVNFNRRGQQGAALNAIVMFYNAGAQGLHMMAKAMHSKRVWQRFLIPLIMLGIAEDIINAALSDEDDDGELAYDKVPAWQRSMFLLFGGGEGIAVPLPYGYNMFVFAGKQLSRTIRRGVTGGDAFKELMQATLTSVSPPIVPTVYEPYRAWTQNTDWRGRPIRPEYVFSDFGPKSHKAYGSTSDLAKGVAQSLNWLTGGNEHYAGTIDIAPGYIDHFVGWLGGGIGRLGQDLWRSGESLAKGEAPELSSIPIVDRLGFSTGIWLDRERFYTRRDEVKSAAAVLKEGGRDALSARDAALLRIEERMKAAERTLRQVRAQREAAYEMPVGAARTDRLQRIEAAEQAALDAFNRAYNDAVR